MVRSCEVDVHFDADAVQIDACTDIVKIEVLYNDDTRESFEFSTSVVTLPQKPGNAIVSLWIDDAGEGGQLGLQFDAPDLEPDLLPVVPPCDDHDDDGVPTELDCDDNNPLIGALLYENGFEEDDGYMGLGPKLTDPWWFDGEAHTTAGGQQALLGQPEDWANTVTFGRLRVSDIERKCGNQCEEDNTRFRAGYLARTNEDADQDEGYHGYRCAVARNSGEDCYDPGPFVQLAAFLDGPEDDINSECIVGCAPNPTFDQLDRQERSEDTNFIEGDSGELVFWVHEQDLRCEFYGNEGEHVVAEATDPRFDSGTTGLSTLNALADFDYVRVCEALGMP